MADLISIIIGGFLVFLSIFSPIITTNTQQAMPTSSLALQEIANDAESLNFDSRINSVIGELNNKVSFEPSSCQKFVDNFKKDKFIIKATVLLDSGETRTYFITLNFENCNSNFVSISKIGSTFDLSLNGKKSDYLKIRDNIMNNLQLPFDISALHPSGDVANGVYAYNTLVINSDSTPRLVSAGTTLKEI